MRLSERTVTRIHNPGKVTIHHAEKFSRPELMRDPHVSTVEGTPTPMNESDDSMSMAFATPTEIAINAGARALGNA